jgi:cobalt-zinc-cadmium efflux system outer membrane protein
MFSILIRRKEYYRIPISILIILTFSQLTLAQSTNRLTLSDAVKIALKNNRKIAILQKDIEKAKGEKQAASRILQHNPEIAGEVINRRKRDQNLTDFGVSLSQPIEIGRRRHYRMEIAEFNLLKAQLSLQKERFAVTEKVKGIFIDLTALNEKFQSVQNILQIEQDLLQLLSIRAAHGEISSVVLHTVKLEVLETQKKLLDIQRAIIAKKRELEWVMNSRVPAGMEIVYGWPEFPTKVEFEKLWSYAEEYNPDLKIASMELKRSEATLSLIKAGRKISNLNFSLTRSREDNDNLIGVGLAIPLPFFNRKTGEINVARAEQKKAALELQRIREKILSELNNSYESLAIMERQKKLFAEQILPITQQNLDEIKRRYQIGEIDLMTLERFWDSWLKAKISYTDFLQEYYHTLCQIELLLGTELEEVVKKQPEE